MSWQNDPVAPTGAAPWASDPVIAPSPRDVLGVASKINPDQAAEAARLAKRYPAPADVLLRNLQDAKLQASVDDADAKLNANVPALRARMTSVPFAQQAHDDVSSLAEVEGFIRQAGRSAKSGVFGASRGAAGVFQAGAEFVAPVLDFLETDPINGPTDWRTAIGGNPLRRLADGFASLGRQNLDVQKGLRPQGERGVVASGFFGGVESLTQNLLALPMAFAPGGQSAALTMMTASTGGNSYQDARQKGLGMSQALPFAASQAAIEYATEKLPLARLLGDVKAGTPFFQTLMRQIGAEIPGEQVATILQDLNEWAVLNPDKAFTTYLEERPSAAAQTLVATIVGAGGNVAVAKGLEKVMTMAAGRDMQAGQSDVNLQNFERQLGAAATSKLRERNPDTFAQFVQEAATDAGAPTSVFVDARELTDALNQAGITDEQLAQLMPSVPAQIANAFEAGGLVEIPVGEALASAPGTPLEQVLLQHARIGLEGLSRVEVNQAGEQAAQYLETEAQRVLQQAQDSEAMQASSDRVRQQVLDQLNTLGRFRQAVNEGYATWTAAFYTTMAGRAGRTPEEFAAKYPLRIVEQTGGGFRQAYGTAPDNLMGMAAKGPAKPFGAQRYKFVQYVEFTTPDGTKHVDAVAGLNAAHAMERARRSWEGSDVQPLTKAEASERDPTIVADAMAALRDGRLNQQSRGSFNPQSLELALSPTADLTTFFHETGHFFLEVMADVASQPDAPAGVVEDMATLLKWFGVPDLATWRGMTLEQQRPLHERFAESIEQYLIEGKAPSVELAPVLRRFRAWVLSVYRSLQQFAAGTTDGPQLSDEVRQVLDRMLASQDQIEQAEEVAGMLPNEAATGEALDKLTARSIRDLKWTVNARSKALKELQAQAAEARKAVQEEVTAEVDASPEMQAKAALEKLRINPDYSAGLAQWKEQRAAAEAAVLAELRAALYASNPDVQRLAKGQLLAKNKRAIDNQVQARMIEWDRENPKPVNAQTATDADLAVVADSYGFPDAETMLQAIDAFGNRADVIEGLTDQRMLEQHGDLIDPRAIAQAANEAVHNEARARALATELKAQADMLGQRTDTGQTNAAGAKITVNALLEAAKQFGANVVARTPLRDLRAKAWQHTAAERRAARRWQEATAKGQTQDAVQAKRDQVLNNAAARAAMDALAQGKKIVEFFGRVAKGTNEKTVEKGYDPDIVNAARAILAAYGIDTPATRGAADYLAKVEQHDPQLFAALQPSVQGALALAQPLQALTFEQLQSLHEEIQSLWHLARRSRMMEVGGNLLDIDDAAAELNARLDTLGVPVALPGEAGALTPGEERTRWLQHAGSLLRRAEQWAEGMDGKYGGPFLRFVFQPVKFAAEAYRTDRLTYRKAYQALVDAVAPSLRKGLIEAPELGRGYTFGRGHNGIGHAELLHAILHTGNESNKRKLLLGRKWATENADGTLDTTQWDAFVKRMQDEGVLGKVHYDFAQGVWDLLEQTKPLAQKAHRDVFGRYFDEVTADGFVTPFGTYRGGYVPAMADTRIVPDADMRALQSAENEAMAYSFPTTNKGFTKGRVEYNRPLILDLRTIGQHIDKVLLFSHMEPAVRDVQRLLSRPAVSSPLNKIDPTIYAGMLTPWLNRSAKQIVETPILGDGRISRVLSVARARAGMALMFANVSNAVQQLTGFSTAFAKLKADGLQSTMLTAAAQMVSVGPKKMARDVSTLSPFMANRMNNEISAINDAMNDILLDPGLLEKAQAWTSKHAYFLQVAMDNTMGPIIWTSAYNGALAKGLGAAEAVHYADGVIRQTQGSTLPEDVSRIETGPAYARLFTQFIGYFNMMANTNATALKQIRQDVGLRVGAGRAFSVVMLGLLVPLWVAESIAVAMKGGPEDDEGDGYLDDWIAAVFGMGTIKGSLAMVPFVGQLATAGINRFNSNPADDKVSASPAISMLEAAGGVPVAAYKLATGEQVNARTAVRDVASLVSIATGLPATAVARPLGYLAGADQGAISPTSTADAARGVVTGVASPESKNR